MGTDCAPLVADLFLFSFELSFMKDLIRTNLPLAGKFNRYIHYLFNPDFSDYISKIYPNELELKQTTEGHGKRNG